MVLRLFLPMLFNPLSCKECPDFYWFHLRLLKHFSLEFRSCRNSFNSPSFFRLRIIMSIWPIFFVVFPRSLIHSDNCRNGRLYYPTLLAGTWLSRVLCSPRPASSIWAVSLVGLLEGLRVSTSSCLLCVAQHGIHPFSPRNFGMLSCYSPIVACR